MYRTTNHLERLDPALSRPGRMDVWVEFKNASKWQCEQLFKNFFPSFDDCFASSSSVVGVDENGVIGGVDLDDAAELEVLEIPGLTCEVLRGDPSSSSSSSAGGKGKGKEVNGVSPSPSHSPSPSISASSSVGPFPPTPTKPSKNAPLDPAMLGRLARQFAEAIPQGEFSVASLQGCTSLLPSLTPRNLI